VNLDTSPTSKTNATAFDSFFGWMPKFDLTQFKLPKMEVPEAFRAIAEKNIAQSKDFHDKVRTAAENATEILQNTCTTAANGAAIFNQKVIETGHTNSAAVWDFAQKLFAVKSPSEFTELSMAHARKQFEVWSEQAKEIAALTQKVTIDTAEPIKAGVTQVFKKDA